MTFRRHPPRAALAALVVGFGAIASCDPPAVEGASGPRWARASAEAFSTPDDAAWRVSCARSHYLDDDPIVFPGRPGAAHKHVFFGNTKVDANSTAASIRTTGNSTCDGGTLNRTGYWVPAIIDVARSTVIDTAPIYDALQVYYKSGYKGVHPRTIVQLPEGLRMIAGDTASPDKTWWNCLRTPHAQDVVPDAANRTNFPTIPQHCQPGQYLQLVVEFPQCWDGVRLDSPDHRSHMAYGLGWPDRGCPSTHPVPLVQITEHFRWLVPTAGTPIEPYKPACLAAWPRFDPYSPDHGWGPPSTWPRDVPGCPVHPQVRVRDLYLSSDTDRQMPGGTSAHADWFNGWDRPTMEKVTRVCINGERDCRIGLVPFPPGQAPIATSDQDPAYDWVQLGAATPWP